MSIWNRVRKHIVALALGFVVLAVGAAVPSTASAGYGHQPPITHTYRTVTKWVTKQVPYKKNVVKYDCGTPYVTYEICYKTIKVPVTYKVKVSNCH